MTKSPTTPRKGSPIFYVRWFGIGAAFLWLLAVLMLVAVRWVNPPTTAVQIQRRLQGWIHSTPYHERYNLYPSIRSRPISSTLLSPQRMLASTSTMVSTGMRFSSLLKMIWKAVAFAEDPPSRNS